MFRRYRRGWIVCLMAILTAPILAGLLFPGTMRSPDELRPPAPAPAMPRNWGEWLTFPARLDPFLRDHFGLRRDMIRLQALVAHKLLRSSNDSVFVGMDGQLFYRSERMIEQSAGLLIRREQVEETAAVVGHVQALLAARGIPFLFASPPNGSTVYEDLLPDWARRGERRTEYDLLLAALQVRGVRTLDLRPVLGAAREVRRIYYRYDTHWNAAGALAAFNAVASAMGRGSWQFDSSSSMGDEVSRSGSDLARMLGLGPDLAEPVRYLAVPMPDRETLAGTPPFPPPIATSPGAGEGPRILIIGDSFTNLEILMLSAARARHVVWLHHEACNFEWKWIDHFRPDEVWWLPTERAMLCWPGRRPRGMPE